MAAGLLLHYKIPKAAGMQLSKQCKLLDSNAGNQI